MIEDVGYRKSTVSRVSSNLRTHRLSGVLSESGIDDKDEIAGDDRLTLSWKDIQVTSKPKGCGSKKIPSKEILRKVDGIVTPCSLMALMGASGAGKTTLLNILNFRNLAGLIVQGKVMLNGHQVDQNDMCNNSVFVQQDDIFMGGLKVKEHLLFHAHLRMKKEKRSERKKRVESVMRQMGLKKCENVKIGKPGLTKGISGGEAKRLAFATEILTKPTLIFCDEPTSGLDSFMARSLVKVLKTYAATGRTILCTIHQPSSETFELFDQICIMAEGRCAFIGSTVDCMAAFQRAGFPCPQAYNPADHYIFTLAVIPGKEDQCRERVQKLTEAFESSKECADIRQDIDDLINSPGSANFRDNKVKLSCCKKYLLFNRQVGEIFKRQTIATMREPMSFLVRLILNTLLSLIIGITWFQIDFRKVSAQQSIPGALFTITICVSTSTIMLLIVVIPDNIDVVIRDYLSGVYKTVVYYIAIFIFFSLEIFVTSMIIINIIYWMVFSRKPSRPPSASIDTSAVYPFILGTNLMVAAVAISIGLFASSLSNSFHVAASLVTPILTIVMLFSGFLIVVDDIPVYFKVFQYMSYFYYSLENEMSAIYDGLDAPCEPGGMKELTQLKHAFVQIHQLRGKKATTKIPAMKAMMEQMIEKGTTMVKSKLTASCASITHPKKNVTCTNFLRGSDVLDHFDFKPSHVPRNYCAMLGILAGFHILAFTSLSIRLWRKRKG